MIGGDFLFTALIPLALLAVVGTVLASGKLKPRTRDLIERGLMGVAYPAFILWCLWRAFDHVRHQDPLIALLFGVAAVGVLHEALKLFRRRKLAALKADAE